MRRVPITLNGPHMRSCLALQGPAPAVGLYHTEACYRTRLCTVHYYLSIILWAVAPLSFNLDIRTRFRPQEPMEAGPGVDDTDDIQAQVLKTTLAEVQTSRQEAADSEPADAGNAHDCCVICLDSISDPCAALPCSHAHFDFLCLVSWLEQHPNCPLCKANVYKVRYLDSQEGESVYRVPNAARTRDSTGRDEHVAGQTHIDPAFRRRFTSQNGLLRQTDRRCPRSPPSPDEAIQRRRHIYRHQLYSLRKSLPLFFYPPAQCGNIEPLRN